MKIGGHIMVRGITLGSVKAFNPSIMMGKTLTQLAKGSMTKVEEAPISKRLPQQIGKDSFMKKAGKVICKDGDDGCGGSYYSSCPGPY
jgi:hypothetical protein